MNTLLEKIFKAAESLSIKVKNPKPNCKKCYGRGYIGIDTATNEPVPCSCIFIKENFKREAGNFTYKPRNRAERRKHKNG